MNAAPASALPLILRSEISRRLNNPQGALADADKAVGLAPEDPNALRERALAFLDLGRFPEALADLERAIALEPGNGASYLYRAMVYEKLGRPQDAASDAARAAALDPSLKPMTDALLAKLSAGAQAPRPAGASRKRGLARGGAIALSLALIVLGLAGTAQGRALVTTTAKNLLSRRLARSAAELDAAPEPSVGTLLGGTYAVVRELGRGGMGVVYEGLDTALQRRVAIKRLIRDANTTEADFERFLQEARTVARLKHPRLAEIYNVLTDGDLYLVFEYVEGEPLDAVLQKNLRLPLPQARRVLGDVAAAVGYAHEQKVIHKDLKPANVMLEAGGGCKVMDFGIAHQASSAATQLTRTSASGTPPYMSPEQTMGSVSKASDLYALGVMAYELLLGRRPFQGPDFLEQKLHRQFLPPSRIDPALPKRLDDFFAQALDPDPAKRAPSAADFLRSFDASAS